MNPIRVANSSVVSDVSDTIPKELVIHDKEVVEHTHMEGCHYRHLRPDMFFALARALFLNHGQDSSLALALVAWGEEHEPLAVKFIADNVGDMDKVRRGLGGLFRAAVKVCPDDVAFWVAEDKESWETLRPYIEKKDAPDLYQWIDEFKKFRLDRADLRVIDHIRNSDAIEREAIRRFG